MPGLTLELAGRRVDVSSADKVLFPDAGITKGDLAEYYARIAERMLPHVAGKPVAMKRYPDGLDGPSFFQKEAPAHFPDWIRRAELPKRGGTTTYVVCDDGATLVYLANQGCITPHVLLAPADRPTRPDRLIVDLDPGEAGVPVLRAAARAVRAVLDELALPAFPKSTGSSGLHIEVPLTGDESFDVVRPFAVDLAEVVAARDPQRFTTAPRKAKRSGRLYVDVLRNAYAQHAVPPYAVRGRPGAPVATPLDWNEATGADFDPRRHTVRNLFRRLAQKSDPWAQWADAATRLGTARARLDELRGERSSA